MFVAVMSEETIEKLFTVLPKLERHLLREVITHRSPTKSSSSQTQKSIILDGTLEQIMQMLAKKSTDICFQIFKAVFVDLSTDKAKQSIENNPNFKANHTFTYGDIEFSSFVNILQRCEPRKGDIFVDLGHGTGRALVAASIMYGTTLSKIRGIELLTELVELSKQKVDLYNKLMDSSPYNEMFAPNVSSNNTRGGMEGETGCAEELRCDISIEEGDFLVDSMNSADSDTFDWTTAGKLPLFLSLKLHIIQFRITHQCALLYSHTNQI